MFTTLSRQVLLALALGTVLARAQTHNIVHLFTGRMGWRSMGAATYSSSLRIRAAAERKAF